MRVPTDVPGGAVAMYGISGISSTYGISGISGTNAQTDPLGKLRGPQAVSMKLLMMGDHSLQH